MLFRVALTRNAYVATRFILLSSTAEITAKSGYVVARNAPPKVRREPVETWKPGFFPTVDLIDAVCNHMQT